jgi:gluconolactonase
MGSPSWAGRTARLPMERIEIFFDGIFTEPQLNHPECVAFDAEGNVWCGGEKGEIFRIQRDGSHIEQIASTGGFVLGIAFDRDGLLYACDLKHAAVYRIDSKTGDATEFASGDGGGRKLRIPNMPVVDEENGCLYVSDSHNPTIPGPGIWRFDKKSGKGRMWSEETFTFANGLVLDRGRGCLYVAETFAKRISRVSILQDGSAGRKKPIIELDAYPDGLTLDSSGRIYITCYEPSLIYRWSEGAGLELLCYDPTAHLLCHPTNCAIQGNDLFIANLGRWHIARIVNAVY